MDARKKIEHATTALVIQQPFWASLLLRVEVEEKSNEWFAEKGAPAPTMATDGVSIYWAADFVDKLTVKQVQGVLSHELAHALLLHPLRCGKRDRILANVAMDLAINPMILESKLELPDDALMPGKDGFPAHWKDWNFEKIYAELEKMVQKVQALGYGKDGKGGGKDGKGGGKDPKGAFGGVTPAPADSDKSGIPLEQQWQMAGEQALMAAKQAGKLPASLERLIMSKRAPKVDWKEQLRRYFETLMPKDYRWSPPNRRFIHEDIYLPSVFKESFGELVFFVDVSGSIGQVQLDQFAAEVQCVADELSPEAIHVVYIDTRVAKTQTFYHGEPIYMKACGGGGTSFVESTKWVEKNGVKPKVAIYLTDLYCSEYPKEPSYPWLWVVFGNSDKSAKAPFGETIHIDWN